MHVVSKQLPENTHSTHVQDSHSFFNFLLLVFWVIPFWACSPTRALLSWYIFALGTSCRNILSFSSFSLAAFCSYGCLSLTDCSHHIWLKMWVWTFWVTQPRIYFWPLGKKVDRGLLGDLSALTGIFFLSFHITLGETTLQLPDIASLLTLGPICRLWLFLCRPWSSPSWEYFLGSSMKVIKGSGYFFFWSSQQVCTKRAKVYGDTLLCGLLGSLR